MWYRITCNSDGSIASCEYHEGSREESGKAVFFVEADSPEQAIDIWSSRYRRWMANRAKYKAEQRADRKRRGLCMDCGRPRDLDFLRCTPCRQKRELTRGKGGPHVELSAEEQAAKARAEQQRTRLRLKLSGGTRAATLRRVLKKFEDLGPMLFREWLVGEVARLEMRARQRGDSEATAAE